MASMWDEDSDMSDHESLSSDDSSQSVIAFIAFTGIRAEVWKASFNKQRKLETLF